MPLTDYKDKNFDIDLDFGTKWEEHLRAIFEDEGSIEVKADRKWMDTGNVVFEIECRGKPSGLFKSSAKWWIQVFPLDDKNRFSIIMDRLDLIELLRIAWRENKASIIMGGDDKASKMVLISIDNLVKRLVSFKEGK